MKQTELKRKTGLRNKGGGLKQTRGPKRKPTVKRARTVTDLDRINRDLFHDAARGQRVCAVTGKPGAFQTHHVLYEQHLRELGLPIWDAMNALRVVPLAHGRHHKRHSVIKTTQLRDENIAYIFDVHPNPADYLRRYYDDSDPDSRIIAHEQQR